MDIERKQFKPPLRERLLQEVARLKAEAAAMVPGPDQDAVLLKARQAETASHLDAWLASPGLQAPR